MKRATQKDINYIKKCLDEAESHLNQESIHQSIDELIDSTRALVQVVENIINQIED